MKKTILVLTLAATALIHAQAPSYYLATYTSTLAGTIDALTVQMPSNASKDAHFIYGQVYCSAACTITLAQNGTAATTTTLATTALNGAIPSQAVAFSVSNVGTGKTQFTFPLSAGLSGPIDLSKYSLGRGNSSNLTISIASFTGTWSPLIQWSEQAP